MLISYLENFKDVSKKEAACIRSTVKSSIGEEKITKELLEGIKNVYEKMELKSSTLDNYYSQDIRNKISEKYGYNSQEHMLSKEIVRIPYSVKGKLIKTETDRVHDENLNCKGVTIQEIENIVSKCLENGSFQHVSVALLLACGSRPCELLQLSRYTKESDGYITQSNIAKKNNKDHSFITKPILFMSVGKFIDLLTTVRENKELVGGPIISQKITKLINATCKELGLQYMYTCRKYYVCASWYLVGKHKSRFGNSVSYNYWINIMNGHELTNITSANNYQKYYIENKI